MIQQLRLERANDKIEIRDQIIKLQNQFIKLRQEFQTLANRVLKISEIREQELKEKLALTNEQLKNMSM